MSLVVSRSAYLYLYFAIYAYVCLCMCMPASVCIWLCVPDCPTVYVCQFGVIYVGMYFSRPACISSCLSVRLSVCLCMFHYLCLCPINVRYMSMDAGISTLGTAINIGQNNRIRDWGIEWVESGPNLSAALRRTVSPANRCIGRPLARSLDRSSDRSSARVHARTHACAHAADRTPPET